MLQQPWMALVVAKAEIQRSQSRLRLSIKCLRTFIGLYFIGTRAVITEYDYKATGETIYGWGRTMRALSKGEFIS